MSIIFQQKKSYVYFTIPHSSYYQLLFNTNTTIYLHNFPPLSLILHFFPFIFFPCYYSPSSHSQRTYLPFVPKPLLQQSQQTSPNLHFASPSSYPRPPFSPNTYEYSHPPPETRGCAKFSPIIRLNICLLTHTHIHSQYNYRRYGAGSFGLCRGSRWKIALFASYTLVEPRILTALEISTRLPCSRTVSTELFSKISRLSSASWLLASHGFTQQASVSTRVKASSQQCSFSLPSLT